MLFWRNGIVLHILFFFNSSVVYREIFQIQTLRWHQRYYKKHQRWKQLFSVALWEMCIVIGTLEKNDYKYTQLVYFCSWRSKMIIYNAFTTMWSLTDDPIVFVIQTKSSCGTGYNTSKRNSSLFPCKSTSFSPQLSHFLSVSHVEHHIPLKRVTSRLKWIGRHALCITEITRRNRLPSFWTKSGQEKNRCLAFSTFTFKQGQNTKSDQINNFQ